MVDLVFECQRVVFEWEGRNDTSLSHLELDYSSKLVQGTGYCIVCADC